MKKFIAILTAFIILTSLSVFSAAAESYEYDMSGVYNSLSDEARQRMIDIGAESADANTLSSISFDGIMNEIAEITAESAQSPLKGLISIIAVLLICSMLTAYKSTLSNDIGTALNIVSALCICSAVAVPAAELISTAGDVIVNSSNLMLAYIPIMALLLTASGNLIGSSAYYTSILAAGEGVLQLVSRVIVPFLNMLLGLSIAGGVSPDINLGGFTSMLSRASKWMLTFSMAVFTAVLGIRQVVTNSLDSVSGRAAKFAISSFVPVVGNALSEAFRTVQGSISVLKSGVGVFVILALAVSFLPTIINVVLWNFTMWIGNSTAEVLNLGQTAKLLKGISDVFSTLIAVLLCVMTIYIISTALVFTMGGSAS